MILRIIIIILIIIIIFHYKKFKNNNDKIEVVQINVFDKNNYEQMISKKQPIILYNYLLDLLSFQYISLYSLKELNMKIYIDENEYLLKDFIIDIENNNTNLAYYENNMLLTYIDIDINKEIKKIVSPLSIYNSINLTIAPVNFKSPLVYTTFERNIFMIYQGEIELYLYKQSDIPNLDFIKTNSIYYTSNKYENNLEKITIKLNRSNVIIIPNNIPYYYKIIEPSVIINS